MVRNYEKLVYVIPVASVVALFALFQSTDPISIGPGGILVVFILLYLFFVSCLFILLHFGTSIFGRILLSRKTVEQRQWHIGVQKSYYIASIIAFAPVCFLAMQSIGQLQIRDITLVLLLTVVAIFYVVKRT
ncbi:hypothetical protein H7Y40_02330 [Pedobacter sp.]|nr:hypothetical protein [Candidatus Saccharibacteria bacterium]